MRGEPSVVVGIEVPEDICVEEGVSVVATHRGLMKKRKQQRGVWPLEGALCRTVPDRSITTI